MLIIVMAKTLALSFYDRDYWLYHTSKDLFYIRLEGIKKDTNLFLSILYFLI